MGDESNMSAKRLWRMVLVVACGHCFLLGAGGCDKDTIRLAIFNGATSFIRTELGSVQLTDLLPLVDIFTGLISTTGT